MRVKGIVLQGLLFLALVAPGMAQTNEEPTIRVEYSNANMQPPRWVMVVHRDGSGSFDAEAAEVQQDQETRMQVGAIHMQINLSPTFTERLFATARNRKLFNYPCESHLHVAFQGSKTVSYSGPEGSGSCTFNYSKDQQIQSLGESVISVVTTIEMGQRLEMLMLHDRLGMDREMETLVNLVHDGSAREVQVIRPTLERIMADDGVLERVRHRASLLLAQTQVAGNGAG